MTCCTTTTFGRIKFLLPLFVFAPLLIKAQTDVLKALKNIKDADSAMVYADKLAVDAHKNSDKPLEARIRYQQSKIIYRTGDIVKAEDYARQALKLATPADSNTYANSSTMIAYMLSQQGKDVEALKVAFKILRETDVHGWKKLNIYSLACIADLYRNIKNIPKALIYAQQAAEGAKTLNDTAQYIFTISTLSNLYSDQSIRNKASVQKAVEYMNIILSPAYIDKLTPFDKSRYLSNLGRLYVIQNNPKAREVLEQSMAISRPEKFAKLERAALIELITLFINNKNYTDAITYGEKALTVNAESSTISAQRDLFQKLSWAYEATGNYKQAFTYLEKQKAMSDSLMAVDKAKDADELDKKYQNDKRLILASTQTKLVRQQRNFIVILAALLLAGLIATYRWLTYKRKREALLSAQEHQQLEKLDAIKTRFFANISHELRTPITLIMGPADQLLNKQYEDEEQAHSYLLTIKRNSKKLLNIVNELLDLGKLEAGKLVIRLKPVLLGRAVRVIYQAFSSAAEFKQINYQLTCNIDEQLYAKLDQERFEKICNNLIGNAIKFTPHGGNITVTAAAGLQHITFTVANTGSGIHPDDLPHIFERYYQGYKHNQSSLESGTGIGLAIAREFAGLMGGSLSVANNWGHGTSFTVTLPLIESQKPEDVFDQETTASVNNRKAHTKLVMIVEDNREMADYISSTLQPAHELITASNGVEALALLRNNNRLPSLIISDVMMPEMDGFTLLETLKQDAVLCTIPVIMLTALADNQHKLKALNIGVDDYLTKPFLNNELVARVTNLINNAEARQQAPKTYDEEITVNDADTAAEVITEEPQPVSPADLVWLTELEALVRKHTGKTDLNLAMLSLAMAISERQLFRRIKNITGLTPNKYIRVIRLQIAREAIESGKYRTIAEVSYVAGFETPAYFSKLFKEHYGRDVNHLL